MSANTPTVKKPNMPIPNNKTLRHLHNIYDSISVSGFAVHAGRYTAQMSSDND